MAFKDLTSDQKIQFLEIKYNELFDSFAKINADVELQKEKSKFFIQIIANNIVNKSSLEAINESFEKFMEKEQIVYFKGYYQKILRERISINVSNAEYLSPEQKEMILENHKKSENPQS